MQVVKITNKEQLNSFVREQRHSQFLQSWEWGEFQKKVAGSVLRLGIQENGQLIAVATIIKKLLPMGKSYFYCPRGPIARNWKLEIRNLLFGKISELAKKEKVIFLRFEPLLDIKSQISNFKFQISKTIDVQPSRTLIMDLSKSEEELLQNMHQKTRYNIRLAERKGARVIEGNIGYFKNFWQLTSETSQRDKFRLHSRNYYHKMLEIDKNFIKLFAAEYSASANSGQDKKMIAANIISFFGDTVTYLHGASSNEYRNVMAPHLLQWYCIKLAKERGYKYYDFSGIDENKWPGLTRFKKSFGGEEVQGLGTFDLIFNKKWYSIYRFVRELRRKF